MNQFIYETHMHTSTSSACGKQLGSEYISYYKEKGYAGIIITDHFFNGNCAVPRDLPWEDKVHLFCEGYRIAKEEGDKQDFDVFFGFEDNFNGDEYLIYGLDEQWLLKNPDIMIWDHVTHYKKIKEAGGIVIQAHPFRERDYIKNIYLHPFQADGFEVANASNSATSNQLAYRLATKLGIKMTAGSDMHMIQSFDNKPIYGVSFDHRLKSIQDFTDCIMNDKSSLYIPNNSIEWDETASVQTPLYYYDKTGHEKLIENLHEII